MRLIAKRPCNFGGHKYFIGEEIPENLVADPNRQQEFGILTITDDYTAELDERETPAETIGISVKAESGDENVGLEMSPEEIQAVFSIMQMSADEAVKEVNQVTSDNVLIVLNAADSRSTVKKAAKKRAEALSAQEE